MAGHLMGSMPKTEAEEQSLLDVTQEMAAPPPEPVAVEELPRGPLPDVGDPVLYYPRPGEFSGRVRTKAAALVIYVDAEKRLCDLCIFRDADDLISQQNVPEQTVPGERGWRVKEPKAPVAMEAMEAPVAPDLGAIRQEVADLRTIVLGEYDVPPSSMFDLIDKLDERLDKIEQMDVGEPAKAAPKKMKKAKAAKRRK